MASKINYNNKAPFQTLEEIPDENKVNAADMNEIKTVVNANADELNKANQNIENLQSGQGTSNADITSLKNRVSTLETDNTTNKSNITNLQSNKVDKVEGKGLSTEDFTTELKSKLESLENYDDTEIKEDISNLESEQTEQDKQIDMLINAFPTETSEDENLNLKGTIPVKFKEFVLKGNSKQETRSGKNLFNKADEPVINNSNIKLEQTETGIKATMIEEGAFDYIIYKLKDVSDYIGKTVRLKTNITYEDTNTTNSNPRIGIGLADENVYSSSRKTFAALTESGEISFTINEKDITTMPYLAVWIYPRISSDSTTGKATTTFDDLIVTVDNEDMTYEPYGAMPSPEFPSEIQNVEGNVNVTVCNKNLIDTDFFTTENFSISEGRYFRYAKLPDNFKTKLAASMVEKTKQSNLVFVLTDTIATTISGGKVLSNGEITNRTYDFTASDNVYLAIGNSNGFTDLEADLQTLINSYSIQIKYGEEVTDYVEHQEQTVTFPLAQGQKLYKGDYLADDGIHHVRKQIELDGTEDWKLSSRDYTNNLRFYIVIETLISPSKTVFSNYFKGYITNDFSNVDKTGVSTSITYKSQDSIVIQIPKNLLVTQDVNGFKQWLVQQKEAGTPVIVEYELAEEVIEPYTEEQQEAYNQLINLKAYEEETNVYSTNSTSPIFKVTAVKDINSVITQLNTVLLERS